jgi:HK97 family phage portal protein
MVVDMAQGASWDWGQTFGYDEAAMMYQRLSWVNTAITIFAQTAAITPLNVLRMAGDQTEDIKNHPFEKLLLRPNPNQSRFEFLEATFAFYRMGDAYWWINQPDGFAAPAEIWVLPPHSIRPVDSGNLMIDGYIYTSQTGAEWPIPANQVVHFKSFNPFNQFLGSQRMESIAMAAKGDLAQQRWNLNLFARDNAKLPGGLAFADMVNETDWRALKSEIAANWGGSNRSGPVMLRGVGSGGVQWISMAMSQQEMEFIASRTFTREEIYSVLAPGSASILSVNATEANAKTGKQTLIDLAVWPSMVSVAQKITNDLLPLYGPDLIAEFDDIRITDKAMQIAEEQAYSRTHTVAETREKFYGDKPLGDQRDSLFPGQVVPEPAPAQNQDAPDTPAGDDLLAALETWKAKAIKRLKASGSAGCEFTHDSIPASLEGAIAGALDAATTPEAVKAIFANAAQWRGYP